MPRKFSIDSRATRMDSPKVFVDVCRYTAASFILPVRDLHVVQPTLNELQSF
jgi:hypothetical protein